MKILGKKTSIQVGDVVVVNYDYGTLMVKRGEEILSFESFLFYGPRIVDPDEDKKKLHTFSDMNTTFEDLFGIILSVLNLTASRTSGLNVGEVSWTIEKYPETSLSEG
jgi:hypothetical protein